MELAQPVHPDAVKQHEHIQYLRRQRAQSIGVNMLEIGDLADQVAKWEEEARVGGSSGGVGLCAAFKLVCVRAALRAFLRTRWSDGEDAVRLTKEEWRAAEEKGYLTDGA